MPFVLVKIPPEVHCQRRIPQYDDIPEIIALLAIQIKSIIEQELPRYQKCKKENEQIFYEITRKIRERRDLKIYQEKEEEKHDDFDIG